jgi:hypothetical protein
VYMCVFVILCACDSMYGCFEVYLFVCLKSEICVRLPRTPSDASHSLQRRM